MENESRDEAGDTLDRVREMPKWAGRYAHNRSLGVIANLGLFFLAFAVIAGGSELARLAGQAGHKVAALMFVTVTLAACVVWVWLVATHRTTKISRALADRLYGAEGTAVAAAKPHERDRATMMIVVAFFLCLTLSIAAGFVFQAAYRYWLPIMAAYLVPFLLYLWAKQGGMSAPFMLLWPGLLVIHAALALAGVRPFNADPDMVTVLVPTFGYGVVAALASHVYSRIALRRLRNLARDPDAHRTGDGQHA